MYGRDEADVSVVLEMRATLEDDDNAEDARVVASERGGATAKGRLWRRCDAANAGDAGQANGTAKR